MTNATNNAFTLNAPARTNLPDFNHATGTEYLSDAFGFLFDTTLERAKLEPENASGIYDDRRRAADAYSHAFASFVYASGIPDTDAAYVLLGYVLNHVNRVYDHGAADSFAVYHDGIDGHLFDIGTIVEKFDGIDHS